MRKTTGSLLLLLFAAFLLSASPATATVSGESRAKEEAREAQKLPQKLSSTRQTSSQTFQVIPEKSLFAALGLGLEDTLMLTYDPSTSKVCSVKVTYGIKDCRDLGLFVYGSYRGKRLSPKKWTYTTTWYLSLEGTSQLIFNVLSSAYPALSPFQGEGRILRIDNTYLLKGNGKLKMTGQRVTPLVSEEKEEEAQALIELFLKGEGL